MQLLSVLLVMHNVSQNPYAKQMTTECVYMYAIDGLVTPAVCSTFMQEATHVQVHNMYSCITMAHCCCENLACLAYLSRKGL